MVIAARHATPALPPRFWRWAGALALYLVAYAGWQLGGGLGLDAALVTDLTYLPLDGAVVWATWQASRRCVSSARLRSLWRLICAAMALYALGDVAQTVYHLAGELPFPAVSDAMYLAYYVPLVAAFMAVPSAHSSRGERLRLGFDGATVALGAAAVVWYALLGPVAKVSGQSTLVALVSIGYPVCDIVLILVLVYAVMRRPPDALRMPLLLLVGAQVVLVCTNLVYGYLTVHGIFETGGALDTLWMAMRALTALAALAQPVLSIGGVASSEFGARLRISWLPYLSVAIGFGLLLATHLDEPFFPNLSLILVAVAMTALVAARQLLAQHDLVQTQGELRAAHDELAALATTDPLTALPNHRALVSAIDSEIERSRRYGRSFGLVFLDIDHFKAFNDALGHGTGDAALRELGVVVGGCLRSIDTVGRWGGEEFVIVLPESDADAGKAVAERVRAAVARHDFRSGGGTHLTCSVGIAIYPADGGDRSTLVELADRAMYAAKRLGRNQVVSVDSAALAALNDDLQPSSRQDEELRGTVEALAAMVDARDHQTTTHSEDVAAICRQLALAVGCDASQVEMIANAARLRDIGKVGVPDAILTKPGSLDQEEWQAMERHPVVSADVVSRVPSLRPIAPIIRAHHERWDGGGYPAGLAGDAIPLGARLIAVADAFSAITSDRPYREARSTPEAMEELRRCAGSQFDPAVVAALAQVHAGQPSDRQGAP